MLNDATCFKQIYIVTGYTNLRFGLDSLASIIESKSGRSPYVPDTLYLFCGRKTNRIKGLVWEKDEDSCFCINVLKKAVLYGQEMNLKYRNLQDNNSVG